MDSVLSTGIETIGKSMFTEEYHFKLHITRYLLKCGYDTKDIALSKLNGNLVDGARAVVLVVHYEPYVIQHFIDSGYIEDYKTGYESANITPLGIAESLKIKEIMDELVLLDVL